MYVPVLVPVRYGAEWAVGGGMVRYRTVTYFGTGTFCIAIRFTMRKGGSGFVRATVLYVWYGEIVCGRIQFEMCVSGVYCLSSRVVV